MVPKKTKYVTYYRVSTQKQGRSGLGLEAQQAAVQAYLDAKDGLLVATFKEVESGKVNTRPQLEAALLRCRQTNATLLVAKLDRLTRDVAFLFNLRNSGVKFQALDIPEANTLMLGVMVSMAQHEREIISKRIKEALQARKARGLPLGNPRDMTVYGARGSALSIATKRDKAKANALKVAPVIEDAKSQGFKTLQAIADHLNSLGVETPRGKSWTPTAVKNAQSLIDA